MRLTAKRRAAFLEGLAATGNVTEACRRAAIGRRTVYDAREKDKAFKAAWDEAEEIACDALVAEARRRAVDGVQSPVVSHGKLVMVERKDAAGNVIGKAPLMVREYSDTLLLALLKAHRPRQFRERPVTVETEGPATITFDRDDSAL
jgi:hypothetical protein